MKDKVKAIIFDVDGVLINCIDDDKGGFLWQRNLERDLGLSVEETTNKLFKKYWALVSSGKMDTLDAIAEFLLETKSSLSPIEFMNYWHKHDSSVNEDVYRIAKELSQRNYRVFIATNQEKYRVRHIKKLLNEECVFEEVFASCEVGCEKPDLKFFKTVQDNLGIHESSILFVDDTEKNVEAAKRLGWIGYHYKTLYDFKNEVFNRL